MGKKKRYTPEEMAAMEKKKNRKQFNAKLDGMGLQYKEEDIPPDEVDRDEVAKDWWFTLKSMIPYTKEYYEGMTAEMEMDDLYKIRVEQAKAQELLSKTRTGKHMEALEEMMDDTNRDFHFFNKLKHQQTLDGKFIFKGKEADPFKYIGRGQNRVRKAVVGQFAMLDDSMLAKLSAHGRVLSDGNNKLQDDRDKCCSWKGKSQLGKQARCFNPRGHFYFRFKTNRRGTDEPEYISHCNYHALSCLGDHDPMDIPKVSIPNVDGLCSECFIHKHKELPPKAESNAVPGVRTIEEEASVNNESASDDNSSVTTAIKRIEKNADDSSSVEVDELTEDTCCNWRPSAEESLTEMRGYVCKNKVYRNPQTRVLYRTCAMHIKHCIKQHAPGTKTFIDIPNVYGYCNTHHMAEFACLPTPINFPYPGMTHKLVGKGWMIKPGHWAAPTWRPIKDIKSKVRYHEPEKPVGYLEQLREAAKLMRYRRRKKQFGKLAAIVIQCVYRGYRVRHSHKPALYQRHKGVRSAKILMIQCQFRRFLQAKAARLKRDEFTKAAIHIQRCTRGLFGRIFIKRHKAAIVLQNSAKVFKERRFFNAVMMMVNLRTVLRRRIDASILIQKIARGYMVRARIYAEKLLSLDRYHKAAVFITKLYGAFKKKKEVEKARLRRLQRNKLLQRLAHMIEELYFQRRDYRELVVAMKRSAPCMQAVVRGFIALKNAKRLKFLRKAMASWCDPYYAKAFLSDYLTKHLPSSIDIVSSAANFQVQGKKRAEKGFSREVVFLSNHVPKRHGHRLNEVDFRTLVAALRSWYRHCQKPLLQSEIMSIYSRFRNPNNSKVLISQIDNYIRQHVEPCHKHARTICGDCVYYRECHFGRCDCQEFKKDKRTGLVCRTCNHPISHHKMLPLAFNRAKNNKNKMLLSALNTVLKPDLSLPASVKGVEADVVADQITNLHKKASKVDGRESRKPSPAVSSSPSHEIVPQNSLSASISALEVIDVTRNNEYWRQKDPGLHLHVSTLKTPPFHAKASTASPHTDISQSEFWSSAAKNPNKTLRDYDEKFEHNLPMPLVKGGEMVYTLEGPAIYVQILEKIVELEEGGSTDMGVHSDEGDFLRLVVDNVQIFERHWRKMVADLRLGTLNRHVRCSEKTRVKYTASSIPRPQLAIKLDRAFRNLGFHMKVVGKDITIKQYAKRKIAKIVRKRRPSLQEHDLGSCGFGTSELLPSTSEEFKSQSLTLSVRLPPASPTAASTSTAAASPTRPSRGGVSSRQKSSRVESLVRASAVGSESVLELERRKIEKSSRGATASRRVRVRRGSDSDITRPTTAEEVHSHAHSVQTEPRTNYHHLVHIDGRFLCPFPVCGKSFTSRDAAFEHLKTHEQRRRFFAPTPLSDCHLSAYWPEGNTWRDTAEYMRRAIPPGAIVCTQPKCQEVFSNKNRLQYHLRWVHNVGVSQDDSLQNFYSFLGASVPTPPNPPPSHAPLYYCSMHLTLDRKCPKCMTIANSDEPKQPIHFFDSVSVNFTKRFGSGGETVLGRGEGKGVYFVGRNDAAERVKRGKLFAVIKDCKGDAWLAVKELISMDEAKKAKRSLPRDADMQRELMLGHVNAPPSWILLTEVKSTFYFLELSRDEFDYRKRNNEIPTESYFIRPRRGRHGVT